MFTKLLDLWTKISVQSKITWTEGYFLGMVKFTTSLDGNGFSILSTSCKRQIQVVKYFEKVPMDTPTLSDLYCVNKPSLNLANTTNS